MRLKYKLGLVVVVVMMAICLFTYQSYALWVATESGQENIVEVGCFEVTFEEISAPISMNNTYPMSDALGLSSTPYKFKITNTCTIASKYYVTLNTTTLNQKEGFNLKEKMKFAIYRSTETKPTNGINLGEYANNTNNINTDISNLNVTNLEESIILATDTLNEGEEVEYSLYLWYDETAGNEVMNQKFEASVNVLSTADYRKKNTAEQNIEYIKTKASSEMIVEDDGTVDHNLRYIGANPNNYVYFNCDDNSNPTAETCELWRIIGVMNNIDNGTGTKETRIKLIRNESIGNYSWDTSESSINSGYGINEWSQADAMKLLNPGHESETVGGSLYWNRGSGTCYNGRDNATTSCDFSGSGLKEDTKKMIGKTLWHTGSNGTEVEYNNILTSKFYELERSTNNGKICTSGDFCNDTITRTTEWTGNIGLMYPSDYGYATSGGTTTDRGTCLNTALYNWTVSDISDCRNNDWLIRIFSKQPWALSSISISYQACSVFLVDSGRPASDIGAFFPQPLSPVLYLKNNVKIVSGEGTVELPFVVGKE